MREASSELKVWQQAAGGGSLICQSAPKRRAVCPSSEFLSINPRGEKGRSSDEDEGDEDEVQMYACFKQQGNWAKFALCCRLHLLQETIFLFPPCRRWKETQSKDIAFREGRARFTRKYCPRGSLLRRQNFVFFIVS